MATTTSIHDNVVASSRRHARMLMLRRRSDQEPRRLLAWRNRRAVTPVRGTEDEMVDFMVQFMA
jgi:hypothetical protein